VAATFERANTYVFAERLIRNAEGQGSIPVLLDNEISDSPVRPHYTLHPGE